MFRPNNFKRDESLGCQWRTVKSWWGKPPGEGLSLVEGPFCSQRGFWILYFRLLISSQRWFYWTSCQDNQFQQLCPEMEYTPTWRFHWRFLSHGGSPHPVVTDDHGLVNLWWPLGDQGWGRSQYDEGLRTAMGSAVSCSQLVALASMFNGVMTW
jgi:hypothetical protein